LTKNAVKDFESVFIKKNIMEVLMKIMLKCIVSVIVYKVNWGHLSVLGENHFAKKSKDCRIYDIAATMLHVAMWHSTGCEW